MTSLMSSTNCSFNLLCVCSTETVSLCSPETSVCSGLSRRVGGVANGTLQHVYMVIHMYMCTPPQVN